MVYSVNKICSGVQEKIGTHHHHSTWIDHISSNRQRHGYRPLSTAGCIGVGSSLNYLGSSQTGCWDGDHACNRDCNFNKQKQKQNKKHTQKMKGT